MDAMYKFDIDKHGDKAELYADMAAALAALTADEPDSVANMANAAALIWEYLPDLNWAGFYRAVGDELIREATVVPKKRKQTRPSRAAKARRMEGKAKRSAVKSLRGRVFD